MTAGPIFISLAVLFAASTALGVLPTRKLIRMKEAQHELRRGSAGWLRTFGGWMLVVLWIMATWFFATILGDWWATGDLDGAIERSMLRLYVLLEILAAFGD